MNDCVASSSAIDSAFDRRMTSRSWLDCAVSRRCSTGKVGAGWADDASFSGTQRFNLAQTPALKTVAFGERAFESTRKLSLPSTVLASLSFGKESWTKLEEFDFSSSCAIRPSP